MSVVTDVLKNLGRAAHKNSPKILTGLGCAGVFSTVYLAVRATPKALDLLAEYENQEGQVPAKLEAFKLTWRCYVPAAVVGVGTIACIIGANTVNTNRNTALAALYSISETALREYQTKVVETIGRNKAIQIKDEIASDKIKQNPPDNSTIIITGDGDVLCYDSLCDRYFESSIEKIRQKANELSRDLLSEMWLNLNELYYLIGLPPTGLGEMVGFDIDKGLVEVDYSTTLTPDGRPCLSITAKVYPRHV